MGAKVLHKVAVDTVVNAPSGLRTRNIEHSDSEGRLRVELTVLHQMMTVTTHVLDRQDITTGSFYCSTDIRIQTVWVGGVNPQVERGGSYWRWLLPMGSIWLRCSSDRIQHWTVATAPHYSEWLIGPHCLSPE